MKIRLNNFITKITSNYIISEDRYDEMTFIVKGCVTIKLPKYDTIINFVIDCDYVDIFPNTGHNINGLSQLRLYKGNVLKIHKSNDRWYILNFLNIIGGNVAEGINDEIISTDTFIDNTFYYDTTGLQEIKDVYDDDKIEDIDKPIVIKKQNCRIVNPHKTVDTYYRTPKGRTMKKTDIYNSIHYKFSNIYVDGEKGLKYLNQHNKDCILKYGFNHQVTGMLIDKFYDMM